MNGRLARAQQLTRAAVPIAASTAATLIGHASVLALLSVALGVMAWRVAESHRPQALETLPMESP